MIDLVTIWSANFSGSTWLSYVLGALPDVEAAGEVHALIDTPKVYCVCQSLRSATEEAPQCPVFDRQALAGITYGDCYTRIAERLATQAFVVADKWPEFYRQTIDLLQHRVRAIVLWRQLAAVWASYRAEGHPFDAFLDSWGRIYCETFAYLDGRCIPYLVLRYEDLQQKPELALAAVCTHCRLPYRARAFRYWEVPQHQLGGNAGTLINVLGLEHPIARDILTSKGDDRRSFYEINYRQPVVVYPGPARTLTNVQLERVAVHPQASAALTRLVRESGCAPYAQEVGA